MLPYPWSTARVGRSAFRCGGTTPRGRAFSRTPHRDSRRTRRPLGPRPGNARWVIGRPNCSPPPATGVFSDVLSTHWAVDWIEALYNEGITAGCSADPLLYCPADLVTRAQMAVFLLREKYGNAYTPPSATGIFADVPTTHWAADWIEALYNEGITSGCSADPLLYCPEASVTRSQMAVFLGRSLNLQMP